MHGQKFDELKAGENNLTLTPSGIAAVKLFFFVCV